MTAEIDWSEISLSLLRVRKADGDGICIFVGLAKSPARAS